MPVNEFEGKWFLGVAILLFFAVDKYYGRPNDLKAFIEAAHEQGIAVIMDIVLNHAFGQNPCCNCILTVANPHQIIHGLIENMGQYPMGLWLQSRKSIHPQLCKPCDPLLVGAISFWMASLWFYQRIYQLCTQWQCRWIWPKQNQHP